MSECNFYSPEEIKPLYGEIVPAYQAAFAGEPWYEVSKCADRLQRCVGGLSSIAIGTSCELCGNCPNQPAYEADELVERFEALATSRPTAWYTEQSESGVTIAAIAWTATPNTIAIEKYQDVPEMKDWLETTLGTDDIVWLDEVFANKALKKTGNLSEFGYMCKGLAKRLDNQALAFRTINPAMTRASVRDFGDRATVFKKNKNVPDRRDFLTIRIGED